jgi:hypothetical protein
MSLVWARITGGAIGLRVRAHKPGAFFSRSNHEGVSARGLFAWVPHPAVPEGRARIPLIGESRISTRVSPFFFFLIDVYPYLIIDVFNLFVFSPSIFNFKKYDVYVLSKFKINLFIILLSKVNNLFT